MRIQYMRLTRLLFCIPNNNAKAILPGKFFILDIRDIMEHFLLQTVPYYKRFKK